MGVTLDRVFDGAFVGRTQSTRIRPSTVARYVDAGDPLLQVQVRSLRQCLMESIACELRCRPNNGFVRNCS
jgi:hypothetical protein